MMPVEIAGQHPRGVADRLAPAELDVAGREEERVARPAETRRPRSDTRVRVLLLAKIIPSVFPPSGRSR